MKLILGLGNPGREYEGTRHNVGWWVVEHLADVWRFDGWRKDARGRVSAGSVGGTRVRLVEPLTYMNLSGAVLRPYMRREGWDAAHDLLVVTDDVALPLGSFRLRARGSAGGHNGLKSIEAALDSRDYARLRVGIGPQPVRIGADLADFVLARMTRAERQVISEIVPDVATAVEAWIHQGIERAMNAFNRRGRDESG